jgi:hypothetical protein
MKARNISDSLMATAMRKAGVLPPTRHLGETELRSPGGYRRTHPFDQYLYEFRSTTITMKDLGEYRRTFMEILSTHPHNSLVGEYREWLFRSDRDLREFQEVIRVGKELTVYLKNSTEPMGACGIEVFITLIIASWAWYQMTSGGKNHYYHFNLEQKAAEYQIYLAAMEEDKRKNPHLYSLI